MALKVQHEELKMLNIKFGNLDTELFNSACMLFDNQHNESYPTETMSTPVDPNINPDQPPFDSCCDPVTPSGKIKAKKAAIQKLSEHDANGTCPQSFQISHTMTFSEGLREFDPDLN
ncbi:hypothetical protein PsorP6_018967 [Peronosclerospora sorghi]|nr:hypothetical protein PsorP6_018967 [Peronosclerospora sorghi]